MSDRVPDSALLSATDEGVDDMRVMLAEAEGLRKEIKQEIAAVAQARRQYMRSRTTADREAMKRTEASAADLLTRQRELVEKIVLKSGISEEVLRELEKSDHSGDGEDRLYRKDLVKGRVATTGMLEDYLPGALEKVRGMLPQGWLESDEHERHRIRGLMAGTEPLSLVKGLRPEGEFPDFHRLRQAIRVTQDYVDGHLAYDHFAGATLVPQIVHLGAHLEQLKEVGGDVEGRIRKLWEGPSDGVDSQIFELLVAAACAEYGREIEFLPETHEKSPDLRCHDPFPMVIECKRRRALSDYERSEEAAMRALFLALETEATRKGMSGRFDLRLSVEISAAPVDEIVARMISQRLASRPERELEYPWGSVAFHELPRRMRLPRTTRVYSPNMLRAVFGWESDLPEWDGIVCRVDAGGELSTNEVAKPIGLVWSNSSVGAVKKRAWSPLNLFGDALGQIPKGEFGVVYLAYQEGARAEIADQRIDGFTDRIKEFVHSSAIRVPISLLVRLYPRPLGEGNPDLIESTVRLCSDVYGDPALFEDFPHMIFTRRPAR